ncbi:endonuclease III [Desulfomarina profundi]|uniref:Endonuclease III n=1 Tax=Desulfomarina profundi TaxID=2772557 RepID=A0A8D5FPY8_9BACT|nr:endonuclease III domain-containing protein [Desulfomarina profundi]BCL59664.1 endonuclease III [Desulfomarina profundi]
MARQNLYILAYERLFDHFGPQNWWPGETPFEIMVGAVLTQNTNWLNVTRAIDNLRTAGVLSYQLLLALPLENLAELIRPSGYYNVKAGRLRNVLLMIENLYEGDPELFYQDDMVLARENLLSVKGIGPETADSILLYACNHPVFVVDAYTHRVFSRHNLVEEETDYSAMQSLFMDSLPEKAELYNEYHALIVAVAKKYCKKTKPLCRICPLSGLNEG